MSESTRKRLERCKRTGDTPSGHLMACVLLEILDKLEELKSDE